MQRRTAERAVLVCKHVIQEDATTREAAEVFGIAHTGIWEDIRSRAPRVDPKLAFDAGQVLDAHKSRVVRALRK